MNEVKIAAALEECSRRCVGSDRPFYQLSQALESYRARPEWTEAEVIELQTRVIRLLTGYWRGPDQA